MKTSSLGFVKQKFAEYYQRALLMPPPRVARREWAFFYFGSSNMHRPVVFATVADLRKFLATKIPSHAYYSTAYYRNPEAPMSKKVWLGADLIFDIDADHIKGCKNMRYEDMLVRVREEIKRLVFDFLLADFGFDKKDVEVYFSGNRGYHAHVREERVLSLTAAERREIVDYILGNGMDYDMVFPQEIIGSTAGPYGRVLKRRKLPRNLGGWHTKMRSGVLEVLASLEKMSPQDAMSEFMNTAGIGPKTAEGIYESLFGKGALLRGVDKIRKDEIIDVFPNDRLRNRFFDFVKEHVKGKIAGETDEPVTADVKRLIRLPGSLHGKTGLRVARVDLEKLDEFDPLSCAVAFSSEPVKINVETAFSITFYGNNYAPKKGVAKVPEFVAVFALCKGYATPAA